MENLRCKISEFSKNGSRIFQPSSYNAFWKILTFSNGKFEPIWKIIGLKFYSGKFRRFCHFSWKFAVFIMDANTSIMATTISSTVPCPTPPMNAPIIIPNTSLALFPVTLFCSVSCCSVCFAVLWCVCNSLHRCRQEVGEVQRGRKAHRLPHPQLQIC